jgi:hypothetical protein
MALFFEPMLECAQKALDAADIVRDGDLSTTIGGTGILSQGVPQQVCRFSSRVQTSTCLLH